MSRNEIQFGESYNPLLDSSVNAVIAAHEFKSYISERYNPLLGNQIGEIISSLEPGNEDALSRISKLRDSYVEISLDKSITRTIKFKLKNSDNKLSFDFDDPAIGLSFSLILEFNGDFSEGVFSYQTWETTIDACVVSTRLQYLFCTAKQYYFITSEKEIIQLNLSPISKEELAIILYRAKLHRKLKFIETSLSFKFNNIPAIISSEDISQIDLIMRGMTRGLVFIRSSHLIIHPDTKKIDYKLKDNDSLIFEQNGINLFGQKVPVGAIRGIIEQAALIDIRENAQTKILEALFSSQNERLNFYFKNFSNQTKLKQEELKKFIDELLENEPSILANLTAHPIADGISDYEAREISDVWTRNNIDKTLYSEFVSISGTFDKQNNIWQVETALKVEGNQLDLLGISLKINGATGDVIDSPPIDLIHKNLCTLQNEAKEILPNSNIIINKVVRVALDNYNTVDRDAIIKSLYSLNDFTHTEANYNIAKLRSNNGITQYAFKINEKIGATFQLNKDNTIEVSSLAPYGELQALIPLEYRRDLLPSDKKPYRAIMMVTNIIDEQSVSVLIYSWNPHQEVKLNIDLIKESGLDLKIEPGLLLLADVNIGARSDKDLYFKNFALAPEVNLEDELT